MDVGMVCIAWIIPFMCALVSGLAMHLTKNLVDAWDGELIPMLNMWKQQELSTIDVFYLINKDGSAVYHVTTSWVAPGNFFSFLTLEWETEDMIGRVQSYLISS